MPDESGTIAYAYTPGTETGTYVYEYSTGNVSGSFSFTYDADFDTIGFDYETVAITGVLPGSISYGQTLVLTGTQLNRTKSVIIDGLGREFTIVNSTTIHVTMPLMSSGVKSIYVEYI